MATSADRILTNGELRRFWRKVFFYEKSLNQKEKTIKLLKKMTGIGYDLNGNPFQTRQRFDRIKHHRFPLKGQECLACRAIAEIRHHVLMVKDGAGNKRKNVVFLCRECHAEIHPWLMNDRGCG